MLFPFPQCLQRAGRRGGGPCWRGPNANWRLLSSAWVVCAALALPVTTAAQTQPRVEVWVAGSFVTAPEAGEIRSEYRPESVNFTSTAGRARQVLALEPDSGVGFEAGAQVFFTRHVGARVTVGFVEHDIAGENTPYDLELDYNSMPPPDYTPRPYSYRQSFAWPATTGTLRHLAVMAGPVFRTDPRRRIDAQATGGLALVRTSGEAGPLGFTRFRMGGHSTFFFDEFRLTMAFEPVTRAGLGLGGDVGAALGPHLSFVAGARVFFVGEAEPGLRVDAVERTVGAFDPPTAEAIEATLGPGRARLPGRHWQAVAGVRVRF